MASQKKKKEELFSTRIVNKFKTFSPSKYIIAFAKYNFKVNLFISIRLKIDYFICLGFPQNGFIFDQSLK